MTANINTNTTQMKQLLDLLVYQPNHSIITLMLCNSDGQATLGNDNLAWGVWGVHREDNSTEHMSRHVRGRAIDNPLSDSLTLGGSSTWQATWSPCVCLPAVGRKYSVSAWRGLGVRRPWYLGRANDSLIQGEMWCNKLLQLSTRRLQAQITVFLIYFQMWI